MPRNIFYDKINTAYRNRKNEFRMTYFEEILNYFKLRNCWLNSKLYAKRKLLHSDENAYAFFVKKVTLEFVIDLRNWIHWKTLYYTLIFLPQVHIFITAFPRSYGRARKLYFPVICENYYYNTNYKHFVWLFG